MGQEANRRVYQSAFIPLFINEFSEQTSQLIHVLFSE